MKLRPMVEEDLETVLRWRNAPTVRCHMYTSHEITMEEHRAWFRGLSGDHTRSWHLYEEEGIPLGVVYFTEIKQFHRTAFWGFYKGAEAAPGTGYRLALAGLEFGFDTLCLYKVNGESLVSNHKACRLHERTGFTREGLFREQVRQDQVRVDIARYGLLASEWRASRDRLFPSHQTGNFPIQ